MTLYVRQIATSDVPLEVEGILPETVRGQPVDQVARISMFHGNRKVPLGDFFSVTGDTSDQRMVWQGDLSGVHWIGAGMTVGEIRVEGSVGRHVGSQMVGGQIEIEGDASDWVGAEMRDGLIRVHGNAGHLVGAAYRGSARGMTGGTILIGGSVGNEIGHSMRRGMLAVGGDAADLIGFNMLAGTILVFGRVGIRHGAGMRRGTIGLLGESSSPPLLSFRHACHRPLRIQRLLAAALTARGFAPAEQLWDLAVDVYNGDMIEGGRGELWVCAS